MPDQATLRDKRIRRFALLFGIALVGVILLPALVGFTAFGPRYLGSQYNVDDHMVYAAWMRQAMDGRMTFDNRFTTDAQPGLTIHLYYLVLGWIAKITGIAWSTTLARAGFSFLFVILLGRFCVLSSLTEYVSKLAISLTCIGGGLGFLVWENFGQAITRPNPLKEAMLSRLPTDVWQPESFVFGSMLTNGLFMVSLCLIAWFLISVLDAKTCPKAVIGGFAAMFLLMNIHSYDVLLVAFIMVGLLVASLASKQADKTWVLRVAAMGLGAIPTALWFVYVLKNDPVFQARAATLTFSPNFRQVLFGIAPCLIIALVGLFQRARTRGPKAIAGAGLWTLTLVILFIASSSHLKDEAWLSMPAWVGLFGVALTCCWLLASEDTTENLFVAWLTVGLTAPYFPALFQRKLAEGLIIPCAILAAMAVPMLLQKLERSARNLLTVLMLIVFSASSVRWLTREFQLQQRNVSNTTLHPVGLSKDMAQIVTYLNNQSGQRRFLAFPGVWNPVKDENDFGTPILADLNPIIAGMTGSYAYIGHWSETPDYAKKRGEAEQLLHKGQIEELRTWLKAKEITYLVIPSPEIFDRSKELVQLGKVAYTGTQFDLIEVQ